MKIKLLVLMMLLGVLAACTGEVATVDPVVPTARPTNSADLPLGSGESSAPTDALSFPTEEPTATPTPTEEAALVTESPPTDPPPAGGTGTPDADVEYVRAVQDAAGTWTFHVTVRHPDTGWEDYANGWDVVLPDGTVILPNPNDPFTRLLLHPHETEQPFTRSQRGIVIPDGVTTVTVRAHDIVDGFGGREVVVDLTQASGEGYEVQR